MKKLEITGGVILIAEVTLKCELPVIFMHLMLGLMTTFQRLVNHDEMKLLSYGTITLKKLVA